MSDAYETVKEINKLSETGEPIETVESTETVFPYELRKLTASDLSHICRIITAIGIKEFRSCFESNEVKEAVKKGRETGKIDIDSIGYGIMFDVVGIITSNIPKAEKELFSFVASMTNMHIKDVMLMPMADYGELLMRIIMLEDFRDFFMRAYKLFK